jgi:CheY-like chemotaxis protein
MPTEDGYSLLRALRAAEREQNLSRLPAVAVTAFARSEDRERAGGRFR